MEKNWNIEQLRGAVQAGGVESVTLEAEGDAFSIKIEGKNGQSGVLVGSSTHTPRRYTDPRRALELLGTIGISVAKISTAHWSRTQHI